MLLTEKNTDGKKLTVQPLKTECNSLLSEIYGVVEQQLGENRPRQVAIVPQVGCSPVQDQLKQKKYVLDSY